MCKIILQAAFTFPQDAAGDGFRAVSFVDCVVAKPGQTTPPRGDGVGTRQSAAIQEEIQASDRVLEVRTRLIAAERAARLQVFAEKGIASELTLIPFEDPQGVQLITDRGRTGEMATTCLRWWDSSNFLNVFAHNLRSV